MEKFDKLVKGFEEAFKYYRGWIFGYEYPGFFAYHQMGGDLTVYFTPDWNTAGKVAIQVSNDETGVVVESREVKYRGEIESYLLFKLVVRPILEQYMSW
jgi:hypothetical protein